MIGSCAKKVVTATIVTKNGQQFVGRNDCENPQEKCPRGDLPRGIGYEQCKSICRQTGHAEINALRAAGDLADEGTMYLEGIEHICYDCKNAAHDAGIVEIKFGKKS